MAAQNLHPKVRHEQEQEDRRPWRQEGLLTMPDEILTPDVTTPAAPAAAPAAAVETSVPTPAPASAPVAATPTTPPAASDAPAATPSTPATPPRDERGRFAAVQAAQQAAETAIANGDQQAAADAIEEIEALLGDQPTKLRADLRFKVGKDGQEVALKELLKSPLLMRDYTRKTQQIAEQRREMERRDVEVQARAKLLASNRERLMQAYAQGGDALAREMRHQELMETDPDYRQRFEESEEFRVAQEVSAYEQTVATQEQARTVADNIRGYIAQACQQHPELDPADIEAQYRAALTSGDARLHADDVDAIIARERQRLSRVTAPVSQELAALKAELAALKAERQVQQHNAATAAAMDKTKAPAVGKPAAGGVPVPAPIKPFNPDTDDPIEWKRRWRAA